MITVDTYMEVIRYMDKNFMFKRGGRKLVLRKIRKTDSLDLGTFLTCQ